MEPWFTVETIDKDTYVISEYRHWEETHCYLLCGKRRALLIDTGLGVCDIKELVDRLTPLPVTVATTHVHWDHIGGHKYFEYHAVHEAEKEWLAGNFPLSLEAVKRNLTREPCTFPESFDIEKYEIFNGKPQHILHDGEIISLGDRDVMVLHTPGHSPGHCCFYEVGRKFLYSGDLVYMGCLDAFYPTTDPESFWRSIQKIAQLQVQRIYPGHHRLAVSADMPKKIEAAFAELSCKGKLKQGMGLFDFGDFQIHL